MTARDEEWMGIALGEARTAARRGEVPVGCVIVEGDGAVLSAGHNLRELMQDPMAHAEIEALRGAAGRRGSWRLDGCTAYVTLEPCAMCAGAFVNARISRVVYGCDDPRAGALRSLYQLGGDPRLNHRYEVVGGVRGEESVALLRGFFRALRARRG